MADYYLFIPVPADFNIQNGHEAKDIKVWVFPNNSTKVQVFTDLALMPNDKDGVVIKVCVADWRKAVHTYETGKFLAKDRTPDGCFSIFKTITVPVASNNNSGKDEAPLAQATTHAAVFQKVLEQSILFSPFGTEEEPENAPKSSQTEPAPVVSSFFVPSSNTPPTKENAAKPELAGVFIPAIKDYLKNIKGWGTQKEWNEAASEKYLKNEASDSPAWDTGEKRAMRLWRYIHLNQTNDLRVALAVFDELFSSVTSWDTANTWTAGLVKGSNLKKYITDAYEKYCQSPLVDHKTAYFQLPCFKEINTCYADTASFIQSAANKIQQLIQDNSTTSIKQANAVSNSLQDGTYKLETQSLFGRFTPPGF